MPSLKSIKISYSTASPPCNLLPPPPAPTSDQPPPPPRPPCSSCQHKNPPPPQPGATPPPPPTVSCSSRPAPPLPPPTVSPAPPPKDRPYPPTRPWIYPAVAPSPYFAPPPIAGDDGGGKPIAAVVGSSLAGLFFLSFLALGLKFFAKKMLIWKTGPKPPTTPGVGNSGQPAGISGDVKNPQPSVPPHEKAAPPSSKEPTPQQESEDRHKSKRKNDNVVIKMLQQMKKDLLLMKSLELMEENQAEPPTTISSAAADESDASLDDEVDEEEDPDFPQESTAEPTKNDLNKEEKTLEDSTAVVKGRPMGKNKKPRKRGSEAVMAALGDVMADGEGDKAEDEEEITAEDPNSLQEIDAEQKAGERDDLEENKILEASAAALKGKPVDNKKKSRKSDSNLPAQPGKAVSVANAAKGGGFMERAIMEDDGEDDDETKSVEEEKNLSTNSETLMKRNVKKAKGPKAKANRSSIKMTSAQQKMAKSLVKSDEEQGTGPGGDGIEDEQTGSDGMDFGGLIDLGGLLDLGGMDPSELMNKLGLGSLKEVRSLVEETSALLQELMKMKKGRRRHADAGMSKTISAAIEGDNDEEELQSLTQEAETDGRLTATEDYSSSLKGRPARKSKQTGMPGLNLLSNAQSYVAEDVGQKSDENEEVGDEDAMEVEEKSPVKHDQSELDNEDKNTMVNVFSTAASKNTKPVKRDPTRSRMQHAGGEKKKKKPISSITDAVKLSGESLEQEVVDGDESVEEGQDVLQETENDDVREEDQDFPQESELDREEKGPVKHDQSLMEVRNEAMNTMVNVFSTPASKNRKPGKRDPRRSAKSHLQDGGLENEKKPKSSITDVAELSGESLEQEVVKGDEAVEEGEMVDEDVGEEDHDFQLDQEQEMVSGDHNIEEKQVDMVEESELLQKKADESGEVRHPEMRNDKARKRPAARNVKAGKKLDCHSCAQGKAKKSIFSSAMESGVFELEQEVKTDESSLPDYEKVTGQGILESAEENTSLNLVSLLEGKDAAQTQTPLSKIIKDQNRSTRQDKKEMAVGKRVSPQLKAELSSSVVSGVFVTHEEVFVDEDVVENTLVNAFSTAASKNMKPAKRDPTRTAKPRMQHAGKEKKKPMNSITDVVNLSGESLEQEAVKGDEPVDEEQDFLLETSQDQEMVDKEVREEDQDFQQESEQQEMVSDEVEELQLQQNTTDESGEVWSAEGMTPADKRPAATKIKAGKKLGSAKTPSQQKSGVLEQLQGYEKDEVKMDIESSFADYKNVIGLDEEEGAECAEANASLNLDSFLKGIDAPQRPVPQNTKVGRSNQSRSDKKEMAVGKHKAEGSSTVSGVFAALEGKNQETDKEMRSLAAKSHQLQQQAKSKRSFLNSAMESGVFEQLQELEQDEEEGMESAEVNTSLNLVSLLEGNDAAQTQRPVSKNTKAGKTHQNRSTKPDKKETAVGKRVSPKPQLIAGRSSAAFATHREMSPGAPKNHELQLQAPTSSSVESGELKEQIDQELPPDVDAAAAADDEVEAEEEEEAADDDYEEEEESAVTAEEVPI